MSPEDIFQKALALHQAGNLDQAAALYDELLARFPNHADTLNMRGAVELQRERFSSATPFFERAVSHAPLHGPAHTNLAASHLALGLWEKALASSDLALQADPSLAGAHTNRGHALARLERVTEAVGSYTRALEIQPRALDALKARAQICLDEGRGDEAISDCDRILALEPPTAPILTLRGRALRGQGRLEDALADLEAALTLEPGARLLPGEVAYLSLQLCAWRGLDAKIAAVLDGIERGKLVAEPMMIAALPSSGAQQLNAASIFFKEGSSAPLPYPALRRKPSSRLRVGYFSTDFHDHAVAHLMLGLLEAHDRKSLEVVAYAFGGDPASVLRHRIAAAVDEFIDISEVRDDEVVALCRTSELQIAVDLNGYTGAARLGLFARGVAPLQVNFLGYPGTMGSPRYDYIIGDGWVTPSDRAADFAERIITLPHSYLVNSDIKRHFIARTYRRAELGLPETGFVFCCLNAVFKITPDIFDVWMRLLKQVDGSVLWLSEAGSSTAAQNLRNEAEARGVDPRRLIFAPRTPGPEYLSRFRVADLFLDTLYYNAHATASDALLVGLPVLTRPGDAFASRVAASLNQTVGTPELIAQDLGSYERMAIHLATHPEALSAIRSRLEQTAAKSPLFDAPRFARNIEAAYREMWSRYEQGLAPDHIKIVEART